MTVNKQKDQRKGAWPESVTSLESSRRRRRQEIPWMEISRNIIGYESWVKKLPDIEMCHKKFPDDKGDRKYPGWKFLEMSYDMVLL